MHGFLSPHRFSPDHPPQHAAAGQPDRDLSPQSCDSQEAAEIRVFQGENEDMRFNDRVGEFLIEGLAKVPAGNQILVRLDLDLSGILKVTATERATGLAKQSPSTMPRSGSAPASAAMPSNGWRQLSRHSRPRNDEDNDEASILSLEGPTARHSHHAHDQTATMAPSLRTVVESANKLAAKAERIIPGAKEEDAAELCALVGSLRAAIERRSEDEIQNISRELEDIVFYLEDK